MGILLVLLYLCLLLGLSSGLGKRLITRGSPSGAAPAARREAFFVNNRASGGAAVCASIVVSCVGASATLGVTGMAFTLGTPAFWWLGAGAFGLTLLSIFLARKVRASGALTMPQMVERFLGKPARPLISCIIVLAWASILAAQFSALLAILQALTGLSAFLCLGLSFALVVVHTLGGQAAIMRIDKLQTALLMGALLLVLVVLSGENPGWVSTTSFEVVNAAFPPEKLLYFLFVVGGNYVVCPMLFGRLLSARDLGSAQRGAFMACAALALCSAVIVSVGLACRGLLPPDTPPDSVLTAAMALLPQWMNLLMLLALVSAIVSSADSCLVTAATVLSHDLLRARSMGATRSCIPLLGLTGLALSLWGKDVLGFLLMAYDVYVGGVVVPVFIGLMAWPSRTIHTPFACAAVVCGGVTGGIAALTGINSLSMLAMLCAGLITVAGLRKAGALPEQPQLIGAEGITGR